MPSTGPTQGAERHAADTQKWQAHPWLARALSTTILLAPVVAAIAFTWGAGRWFPPERFGIGRWPWMGLVFIAANLILFVFGKLFRRLTPLVGLMRLSLIFPDQAPSRAKATLRSSNSRKLLRQIEEDRAAGKSGEEVLNGDTLVDLLTRLNEHDRLTRGHSERVRAYSELIGTELKLSDDDMNKLRWSALLHDVGKLTVDPEILNKDGRPTDEEWAKLKEHPAAGGHILEPLRPWLGDWIHAADQHHMRWDGNGYPSGLAGHQITLAGRIVAVADAYDVMTSARSYKKPLDPEVARTELTACAGSQFDPDMVRAFLNIGLGRLRAVAGPLAWLSNALGVAQVPVPATTGIATAASTVAGGVATAVVATATGLLPSTPPEPTPPELIAFEEPATPAFSLVAGSVELTGSEDQAMVVTLSASGATTEAVVTMRVGAPARGAVGEVSETTISPEGLASATVEYRPPVDYFGEDGFSYEACDSYDRCSAGSVRLSIEGVNDAPRPRSDRASVAAGQSVVIDVVANDADAEPGDLTVIEAAAPEGTVVIDGNTLVYTPDPETSGEVVISYVVVDADGLSAAATVIVDVEAAPAPTPTPEPSPAPEPEPPAPNPDPVPSPTPVPTPTAVPTATPPPPNLAPLAAADQATIDEDTVASVDVLANDRDPEGEPLTITGVSEALNGAATLVDGRIRYQPAADQHGTELLTYTVSDGTNPDVASTLTVVVNPVNDRPVIEPSAFTVAEGTAPGTVLQRVTSGDVDGDALMHQITAGDPTGRFSIDAAGDITLAAPLDRENQSMHTLTITVSDGSLTAAASVTVTVSDVDEAPTAGADFGTTDEDQQTTIDIGANDADPEGLALTWQVPAVSNAGAALSEVGGVVTYVPKLDHNGVDTFTYVAVDPAGNPTDPTTVTVTVASVNDAPVANDDIGLGFATVEDVAIDTASVVANDTDVDHPVTGDSVELVTQPGRGTAVDLGDGRIRYTPNAGVSGTDTFTYRIKDADNAPSAPATVTITITPVNDDPVLTDPGDQQAAVGLAFSLPATATDPENDDLTFTASGLPPGFSVDPDTGAITGTPAQGTEGTYGVELTVTDDGTPAGSDAATFTIEVVTWQLSAASSEVMMTEVLYFGTANPFTEFVEVLNAGATPIDLAGWSLQDFNLRVDSPDDLNYVVPASDHTGNPSTLAPGERAVFWVGAGPSDPPPLTGLGLEYLVGGTRKLDNGGDSVWLVDDEGRLVDFMAYKSGGGDTPPPAALGQWDDTHQGDLDVGFSFGLSLALSTDGVDGNTAACWEPTNSEVADDGRCPGVGDTDDNDGIGYLTTSVGRANDT